VTGQVEADVKQAVVTLSQQPVVPDAPRHAQSLSWVQLAGGQVPPLPSGEVVVVVPVSGAVVVPVSGVENEPESKPGSGE
jgi:hypothetical protein